jgi:hypothetical protein
MSPRQNWYSPNPSLARKCAPPPRTGGGGGEHTRLLVRGWGTPNSDDWRKGLALCLLCGPNGLMAVFEGGKRAAGERVNTQTEAEKGKSAKHVNDPTMLVVRTNSLRLYGRRSYAMLKNQPTHTILSQCSRRRNYMVKTLTSQL